MRKMASWLRSHGSATILPSHSIFFTNGSARGLPRKRQCAGWRFAARTACPRYGDKPPVDACGPVQTAADADSYVGATHATNNAGEMSVTGIQCSDVCGGLAVRQGASGRHVRGKDKLGARHAAAAHVGSDEKAATTQHWLGMWSHG